MDILINQKQVTADERASIDHQVKNELIEHLYQGCLPGTISGIPVGIAVFIDFYHYTPTALLVSWYLFYNAALLCLTALYFFYRKYKNNYSLKSWLLSYSIVMSMCALTWAVSIALMPDNMMRQYFAFIALFLVSTGYAMGSIGVFELCLTTLAIIVVPLVTWCFLKGALFYNLVGCFSLIYIGFMTGINGRSTQWFKDSLKLKLENTLVSYQANHDLLTGLPNQRLLPQYIEAAIASAQTEHSAFAVLCFSLNRMEILNDSLGPKASNSITQSVAKRLNTLFDKMQRDQQDQIKCVMTISRKDAFNIIMMPLKPEEAAQKVEALLSVLEEPFYLEKKGVNITASVGVSFYPQDGETTQALVVNAEASMLEAKQFGGSKMEFYRAEINAQTPKQLELETDLHNALKKNQFLVYYQPLIDVKTGTIHGMEALIRWVHPVHGFISPMQFIPIAEETGLIISIGEWVLREACKQTQAWHQMGFNHLKVAVNFAGKQLQQDNILDTIKRALIYTGLDAKFLELEITETAILNEKVINLMSSFKELGLSLSVDDFGTGYSGLSYLKRFSIDKLKIDQSFVKDIPGNKDSVTIVSAILAMAKELNVTTLAEGVETVEQLKFLQSKGCDYIQGYYFSKPLETSFFTQLLLTHRHSSMYQDVELS